MPPSRIFILKEKKGGLPHEDPAYPARAYRFYSVFDSRNRPVCRTKHYATITADGIMYLQYNARS